MRKAIGYIAIFALGLWLGYAVLRNIGMFARGDEDRAKRNVIAILDRTPIPGPVGDTTMVRAAARIEPAVVNIDTLGTRSEVARNVFGQTFEQPFSFQGKGSGVIISGDGYVVTNNHVIEGARVIRITTLDNRHYDGRLVGADPDADLAVLKIDAGNLPSADLGESRDLKVGEYVLAIGNPLGVGTTVTHGIISATDRRNLPVGEGRILSQALQTDAPINKGNSGGALANMSGQLIGINTAIASERGGGNIGIGFAIPIDAARSIIKDLIAKGKSLPPEAAGHAYLGIATAPLPEEYAQSYSLQPGTGLVVVRVEPLSSAADAGLQRGDIIIAMDGKAVSSPEDFRARLGKHKVGERVDLRMVTSDGTARQVKVSLGRRPAGV